MMGLIKQYKNIPPKLYYFYKEPYTVEPFRVLDVGCGNHSATETKKWFPQAQYYGVDNGSYFNDKADFDLMEQFFDMDLEKSDLSVIEDQFFDVIIFAHVIEHLDNGLDVLKQLTKKLKPGGYIYIEWPSEKSVDFPPISRFNKKEGCLNFYDDPTHKKIYTIEDLNKALSAQGLLVKKKGIFRNYIKIMFMPFGILLKKAGFFKGRGKVPIGLWDYYGFRAYVLAQKTISNIHSPLMNLIFFRLSVSNIVLPWTI